MIHELQQALWVDSPKGLALVKFLIDRGLDADLEWVTIINETGECWTFSNEDIRFAKNYTQGRRASWEAKDEEANSSRRPEQHGPNA